MSIIKKTISKLLRKIADKIDSNTCELTEAQAIEIMSVIGHNTLSKDEACNYLNISRSKFDSLIREGKLPKGRKRRGFKELFWYQDEISSLLNNSIKQ